MNEDYKPFGDEWRKHMKTLKKELIIDMLKEQGEKRKSEIKHACRIMADLLTCYNLELEDGSFACAVTEEGEEVARFLEKNGFAVFDQDESTVRIHWEKLSEEKP